MWYFAICSLWICKKTPLDIFDKVLNTLLYHVCDYHCLSYQYISLNVLYYLIREIASRLIVQGILAARSFLVLGGLVDIRLISNILLLLMMMNYFCGMVNRQKAVSLITSRDHCRRYSLSRVSDTPQAGSEPAQSLNSGFVEWTCAVVITTAPWLHITTNYSAEVFNSLHSLRKMHANHVSYKNNILKHRLFNFLLREYVYLLEILISWNKCSKNVLPRNSCITYGFWDFCW